ncbi:unnamed protein product [marine sediment metagenome]|uniref:Uncharacterized protein n=1 Tax=marine sediment metagenome TaxID=412755 RepID=X0SMQ3_9ZZZZ
MTQSFRALLAEKDAEYVYHIKSTRHLHDDDIFGKLQIGMLGYDLRSLERVSYNPLAAVEPMFHPRNDEPGLDKIFHVRVVLGTDVANGILRQKVAYFTDINWKYLVVHKDGEKMEDADIIDLDPSMDGGTYKSLAKYAKGWDGTPDEGDIDSNAQQYAGQNRIDAFMSELSADRKDREAEVEGRNVQPNLTESFVTSHLALGDVFGNNAPKGFYLVERLESDPSMMHIEGPFKQQPSNYDFVANLLVKGVGTFEVQDEGNVRMVEHDRDFRFTRPLRERMTPTPFEVSVQDQDTGKTYTVLVKALSETDAREKGVQTVAQQEQLNPSSLIAVEPNAVG